MIVAVLTRLAVVLCLMGQCAQTIGLPVLVRTGETEDCSKCGCCPADRTAQLCCCVKPAPPKPAPTPAAKGCCHVEAKPERHECCEETEVEPEPVTIVFVAGVFAQKCHGPVDGSGLIGGSAVTPDAPTAFQIDLPGETTCLADLFVPRVLSEPPTPPPPRAGLSTLVPSNASGLKPGEAGVLTDGGSRGFVSPV